jgi:carbonic anhydrase
MWKLMEGIILFREVMPKYAQRFRKLASNQPDALFIVCSDSRVVVPSGMRLEFSGAFSGNMKVSFQAARSIG